MFVWLNSWQNIAGPNSLVIDTAIEHKTHQNIGDFIFFFKKCLDACYQAIGFHTFILTNIRKVNVLNLDFLCVLTGFLYDYYGHCMDKANCFSSTHHTNQRCITNFRYLESHKSTIETYKISIK